MIRGHFLISASDLIGRANSNRSSVKLLLAAAVLTSTAFGLWLGYPTPRTEHSARMRGGDPPEFSVEKLNQPASRRPHGSPLRKPAISLSRISSGTTVKTVTFVPGFTFKKTQKLRYNPPPCSPITG